MAVAKRKMKPHEKAFVDKVRASPTGRLGGRAKGQPNHLTKLLREAIPEAVERLGSDGRGKDGLVGWLMQTAKRYPEAYLKLLDRLLPIQISTEGSTAVKVTYTNKVEIVARLKERGLPIPPSLMGPEEKEPAMKTIEGKVIEEK